ncbi:unnamed protein product [Phytomonas sp. EM1]|nr:unnamed protein product [Phytomonas sp. EM1]|eukprot:CCW60142.1 unnamed protein product [Phytomonas sp. isolate EM1]
MFFLYSTPEYPRKPIEYIFKVIYQLTTCFHIISLVILSVDFHTRLAESLPDYFSRSTISAHPSISMVMQNCTYRGMLRVGFAQGVTEVALDGVTVGLVDAAKNVSIICFLELLHVINNLISSVNYAICRRHLRVFGVHVPFYHILVVLSFIYSIAIIALVCLCDREMVFYRDAINFCADKAHEKNATELLVAEYDKYNILTTPIFWPLVACCFSLLVSFVALAILIDSSSDKATLLHSQANAPWESRTPFCTTKKSVLRLHTAQRKAILKDARTAMQDGLKVRIVRSYQLMSEDDFKALVQAMRDQVARAMKQKQFENLKEHFGDHESQIESTGLLWRQNPNWSPPLSPSNTEQANYFDDVEYLADNSNADHFSGLPSKGPDAYDSHNRTRVRHSHSADSLSASEDYKMHLNPYDEVKNKYHNTTAVAVDANDSVGGPYELPQTYAADGHPYRMSLPPEYSPHSHSYPSHHHHDLTTNDVTEGDSKDWPASRNPIHHDIAVPTDNVDRGSGLRNRHPHGPVPFLGTNPTDGNDRQVQPRRRPTKQAEIEDEITPADEFSDSSDRLFGKR